jgi:hypothetical protein
MAIRGYAMYWLGKEVAMQLIDLILLACSLTDPTACHEYHVLFQSAGSLEACTIRAQPYLAQWVGDHPNFRIARWHCAWPDREDEKS